MKLYSDIGKVAKKLLSDDYVFTNKLKLSSKTPDGFSYTITGVQNAKEDSIDADVTAKFKLNATTFTGKLFTGGKKPTTELKYESKDANGRKLSLSALAGKDVRTTNAEIVADPLGITLALDALTSDVYASGAIALMTDKYKGFVVAGGEMGYNVPSKDVGMRNWAVSYYDGKESECSVHVLDKGKKGMISYSHHVRPGFSVAAQMCYVRESKETTMAMGTAYRMDGGTTVKAKMDSDGGLALSYIQDIRPNTCLIMSSKFNTRTFDSAKVGVSLTIE